MNKKNSKSDLPIKSCDLHCTVLSSGQNCVGVKNEYFRMSCLHQLKLKFNAKINNDKIYNIHINQNASNNIHLCVHH